jgi:hypothetical protein
MRGCVLSLVASYEAGGLFYDGVTALGSVRQNSKSTNDKLEMIWKEAVLSRFEILR